MSAAHALESFGHRHPEWKPWLAVVCEIQRGIADCGWDAAVPGGPPPRDRDTPLLARATLRPDARIGRLLESVRDCARGAPCMAGLTLPCSGTAALAVFRAALNGDDVSLGALASGAGADPDAFRAVVALLPVPFLHACSRRWSGAIPEGWSQGYCPVCGAWPAFAEVCGVERSRYLRCGRCGSAWQSSVLSCPYCGMTDHEQLASLIAEQEGSRTAIDVCRRCHGYVKAFTRLRASAPAEIMVEDLASVELDVAAATRDYRRPRGVGYALDVTLTT